MGVKYMGLKPAYHLPNSVAEGEEESRETERGYGGTQGSLVQPSGVGDSLQHIGSVAKAVQSHSFYPLIRGRPGSMGSNDLDVVTLGGDAFGDASDKSAGRVADKARIVVGHHQNTEAPIE
jgi:hypothetical protein